MKRARPPAERRIRFAILALAGAGMLAGVGAAVFAWSGVFDVAATTGHSWPVALLLHYTMERSVAVRAGDLRAPDLGDPVLIARGAAHYATGCAPCHGGPGELASPIAQGMLPVPPGLYSAGRDFSPNQLFWIVQNGIKMTAMPSWPAPKRADEIWAMVAFLRQLSDLKTVDYAKLAGWAGGADLLLGSAAPGQFDAEVCARCHGADGKGRGGIAPDIAGLGVDPFITALRAYRDGSRPSGFMQPVAATLTDEAIQQAAAYYSAQPRGSVLAASP